MRCSVTNFCISYILTYKQVLFSEKKLFLTRGKKSYKFFSVEHTHRGVGPCYPAEWPLLWRHRLRLFTCLRFFTYFLCVKIIRTHEIQQPAQTTTVQYERIIITQERINGKNIFVPLQQCIMLENTPHVRVNDIKFTAPLKTSIRDDRSFCPPSILPPLVTSTVFSHQLNSESLSQRRNH